MKILVAADSFKDALPSLAVCRAIQRGIERACPDAACTLFPMADGGEGTADILAWHLGGETIDRTVADPLGRPVTARYFFSEKNKVAFIEMAQASGLERLKPNERNPLMTNTYGTGELIADALKRGACNILLGIGGSATNDGGMGMAAALGWRFFSKKGEMLEPIGENLTIVETMVGPDWQAVAPGVQVEVLCDVTNPLFGPDGAAQVFARQKGADEAAVEQLDAGLRHFSTLLEGHFGKNLAHVPGAGAAGGMGAGAMAFLHAALRPGADLVMELTGFEQALEKADLVITGEGKLDGQTAHGKLIHRVCQRAAGHSVPVIAFCGTLDAGPEVLEALGLRAAFSLLHRPMSLPEALASTADGLALLAFNVLRLWAVKLS